MPRKNQNVERAFTLAKARYAELGVDVDAALKQLSSISISLHCWQGDDVGGFENAGQELGGGLAVTGNYPGKARTPDELRADFEAALGVIPGDEWPVFDVAGIRIGIYSSGSVRAQRLIFGHSDQGDLSGLISANFDTTIGTKREVASYIAIADALGSAATRILFLSDIAAELDAAASAGMRTCQLVRPQDGTLASDTHPKAADFSEITGLFTLA